MPPYYKVCDGYPCPYCERAMDRFGEPGLAPTRDHVVPRSRGGTRKIVCCSRCNHVKRNLMPDEWEAFMAANPGWWLLPDRALRIAHREHRRGRAQRAVVALESDADLVRGRPSRAPVVLPSRFAAGAVRIVYPDGT